ncbi:sulfite exporter TauE/SafE family protein [Sulfurospirillum oryzae]|uniref:sulfite exporter TauE/SafE family protein n=1 Tax=Sulfurospirillum oryzae TaxID=2976535 RepID=UPI0021E8B9C1|nr:sulfite exporter TauE/SafE family protein [Sulfurospirillum oryzae]
MDAFILGFISFCTSLITSVVGIGGGLLLISILPIFLPTNALIPIHSLNQITSNISRAYFGHKDIQFQVIPKFLIGSLIGIGIFMAFLKVVSLTYIPLFLGAYILLSLWSENFNKAIMKYESYYVIGFFQTGVSVIVGTTGQLTMTKLLKEFKDKNKVVATSAILMCLTHVLKIIVFIYFGFVFRDYLSIVISMIIGSIVGSYIGTQVREKIDGKKLIFILKIFLSILAVKSILSVI